MYVGFSTRRFQAGTGGLATCLADQGAAISRSSCVGLENEFTLDCCPFASLSPTQTSGQRRWKQYDREEGD